MAVKKEKIESNVAYRSPAAILASERGEDTYIINIAKRYEQDSERHVQVDDNQKAVIPTDEDVEVAENEYFALKASAELRKMTNRLVDKLVHKAENSGGAL